MTLAAVKMVSCRSDMGPDSSGPTSTGSRSPGHIGWVTLPGREIIGTNVGYVARMADRRLSPRALRVVRTLAAAGAVVMIALSLIRFVDFNAPVLYGIVPVAPLLAAIAMVALAATYGRWTGALVVGLVLTAAVLSLPGRVVPRTGCELDRDGLTIMSHNVHWQAGNAAEVAAQIIEVDPDVVLLQEGDEGFRQELLPLLGNTYPHIALSRGTKTTSMATLSRWPLVDVHDTWQAGRPMNPFLITTVETPDGPIRVANVHTTAPVKKWLQERHENEYRFLMGPPFQTEVDVLMGDFNASNAHLAHRRFVESGFVDAHREVGCGVASTWTPGPRLAVLSLDHMLTAPTVEPRSFEILDFAGSDHRAIVGSVRVG